MSVIHTSLAYAIILDADSLLVMTRRALHFAAITAWLRKMAEFYAVPSRLPSCQSNRHDKQDRLFASPRHGMGHYGGAGLFAPYLTSTRSRLLRGLDAYAQVKR